MQFDLWGNSNIILDLEVLTDSRTSSVVGNMIPVSIKTAYATHWRKITTPSLIDFLARWLLAMVFLVASIPKILSPGEFAEVIAAYGLVPELILFPVALALCWGELVTAIGLVLNKWWALIATLVFMVVFIAVLSYGIYLGLDIDCGCFGPEDPEHEAFSGLRGALVRDLLLMIPLLFACRFRFQENRTNNVQEKK
jgi:uncharacterized membrane protein YphA (DoxX/SURF4 family)